MELKKNMYVRLDRDQGINKIEALDERYDYCILDKVIYDEYCDETVAVDRKDIINASYNIIDLIEMGDYVNGKKVIGYLCDVTLSRKGIDKRIDVVTIGVVTEDDKDILKENIKSIVTSTQFKSVEYEVIE